MRGFGKEPIDPRKLESEARGWLVRLSSGSVTEGDLAGFKAWLGSSREHQQAFEHERRFWQQLEGLSPLNASSRVKRPILGRRAFLGTAAVAAIGAFAYPRLNLMLTADFRTVPGEQRQITLPDGSAALLNTDTAISLHFTDELRHVRLLQGEVQFEANTQDQRPFQVLAQDGISRTGGASFAVLSLEQSATVTVLKGDVRVSAPAPDDEAIVSPNQVSVGSGQQTRYAEGGMPSAPVSIDTDAELAWRRGRLVFSGRPFARAVKDVARYLPERVILVDGAHESVPVSAAFSTKDPLSALDALAGTQGLHIHRVPGIAVIIS